MNIYFNMNEWKNAKQLNFSHSLIIDISEGWEEENNAFMSDLRNEKERTKLVKDILVRIKYEDYVESDDLIFETAYIQFTNEEDYIEEILKLGVTDRLVGNTACKTETDLYNYYSIGITNLFITSPLLNQLYLLEKYKKQEDLTFFALTNKDSSLIDNVDMSWLRPETLKKYEGVLENIEIVSSEGVPIAAVFRAYKNKKWLGRLREIIVGFGREDNPFKDIYNFMPTLYDSFMTTCGDNNTNKEKLKREYQLTKKITERELH